MNKNAGVELLKIAAFLYAMRYVVAAIFMGPGLSSWSKQLFHSSYTYVGPGLTIWAAVFAAAAVIVIARSDKKQ